MAADTQYVLRAAMTRQILPAQGGTFGIVNNDPGGAEIWITIVGNVPGGSPAGDVFYLRRLGESLTLSRGLLGTITIEAKNPTTGADQYPATILLVDTDMDVSVTSLASAIAGASSSGSPFGGFSGPVKSTVVSVGNGVATALPASIIANRKAVIVQADTGNTLAIYIGGSTVTAGSGAATGGYSLTAGQSLPVDLGAGALYAIAAGVGQKAIVLEFS